MEVNTDLVYDITMYILYLTANTEILLSMPGMQTEVLLAGRVMIFGWLVDLGGDTVYNCWAESILYCNILPLRSMVP